MKTVPSEIFREVVQALAVVSKKADMLEAKESTGVDIMKTAAALKQYAPSLRDLLDRAKKHI